MKKLLFIAIAATGAISVLAQGTLILANQVAGQEPAFPSQIAHVYAPLSPADTMSIIGLGVNDLPVGATDFGGRALIGASGLTGQYGAQTTFAQYLGAVGAGVPVDNLQPVGQATTFRTGADAGFLTQITSTLSGPSFGAGATGPFTFTIAAWDNSSGLYPTWAEARPAWEAGMIAAGTMAPFTINSLGGGALPPVYPTQTGRNLTSFNLYFVSAVALSEDIYFSQSTSSFPDDRHSTCLGRAISRCLWVSYAPAQSGTATVDTCPSSFDTQIEVYTAGFTSIGCNDDSSACGALSTRSSLSFPCTAGTTYYICAGGYAGAYGNLQIRAHVVPDADADGYSDGVEVHAGSNPNDPTSIPHNLASRMDATGILGTMNAPGGTATPVFHMGAAANINDGDLTTRVDTWNSTGTDPLSYVGIMWSNPQNGSIRFLRLDFATFGDGGWFGPNNMSPGPGGTLSPAYLSEPDIQVTYNRGATWASVAHTSEYFTALNGHQISTSGWNPTRARAIFRLDNAVSGVNGIRLVGSEGGIASGGFLGVFELGTLIKVPIKLLNPQAVRIGEFPRPTPALRFEFDSQPDTTYEIQLNGAGLDPANWTTIGTTQLTEQLEWRITVAKPVNRIGPSFFRVMAH